MLIVIIIMSDVTKTIIYCLFLHDLSILGE